MRLRPMLQGPSQRQRFGTAGGSWLRSKEALSRLAGAWSGTEARQNCPYPVYQARSSFFGEIESGNVPRFALLRIRHRVLDDSGLRVVKRASQKQVLQLEFLPRTSRDPC